VGGGMKLSDMLVNKPPIKRIPNARKLIRENLIASHNCLIVIDDDPTGTQTIQDVNVFMDWSEESLGKAFDSGAPVFFISTNSRSLSETEAKTIISEVGQNLSEVISSRNKRILLAFRSDSTLRGHFPSEENCLVSALELGLDGIIIAPAFFEAGRYTIDDIQWAEQDGELTPVHETEFARDPFFSYKNSNLKAWVMEKIVDSIRSEDIYSISLKLLREGGPEAVASELMKASGKQYFICNATCYEDYEILVMGIIKAESRGKKFAYHCAASFIKARGGFKDKQFLTRKDLAIGNGPGLIVVGSYVEKTSRQLTQLLNSGLTDSLELRVGLLRGKESAEREINSIIRELNSKLGAGQIVTLYTSRTVDLTSQQNFRESGNMIEYSLCEILKQIQIRPEYLLVKGGFTSIEIAKSAINVKQAYAIGQIISGVPVWCLGAESSWPDIHFIIFPGNVGDDNALLTAVRILAGK